MAGACATETPSWKPPAGTGRDLGRAARGAPGTLELRGAQVGPKSLRGPARRRVPARRAAHSRGLGQRIAFICGMELTSAPLVRSFMTPSPHTVGRGQPLLVARSLMHQHRVRHLPVLDGGKLVGLLSERDLGVVEGLPRVDAASLTVEDAMTAGTYVVSQDAPLATVAAEMAETKFGAAVVMDGGRVVGVFTSVDALRALAALLGSGS